MSAAADSACFAVVIHAENPTEELDANLVSKMFLKKIRRWEFGEVVVAVDHLKPSPVRSSFSRAVHRKSTSAVNAYWQKMIFSGREVPPETRAGDREVLDFVRSARGAVGYVSCEAIPAPGVRELQVTGTRKPAEPRKEPTSGEQPAGEQPAGEQPAGEQPAGGRH